MTRKKSENFTEKLLNLISEPQFIKFENILSEPNFFKIVGRAQYERWHSSFIGWLLDSTGSHLLNDYTLRRFLMMLLDEQCIKPTNHVNDFLLKVLPTANFFDIQVSPNENLHTETSISGVGRFDIFVSAKFSDEFDNSGAVNIVFELKIDSKPSSHQSNKYADWLFHAHDSDVNFLIYLTPNLMNSSKSTVGDDRWYCMDYQLLNDKLLIPLFRATASRGIAALTSSVPCSPALTRGGTRHSTRLRSLAVRPASGTPIQRARGSAPRLDHPNLNEKVKPFIIQYIKNLKTRYKGIKMAITNEEKRLALALYDKYSDVFDSIYDALVSTGTIDFSTSDTNDNKGRKTGLLAIKINGNVFSNETVRLLFEEVLKFIVDNKYILKLPLPWGTSNKRYILTNEDPPKHPNDREFFYPVKYKGYTIESHYARDRGLKVLSDLCEKLEIDCEIIET